MRIVIIALIILGCLVMPALAKEFYYIVDINNEVIAKLDYKPSQKDLDTRNEIPVKSKLDLALEEAEYRNGEIVKHVLTADEINAQAIQDALSAEFSLIEQRSLFDACDALEKDGVVFDHINCTDFE